MEEGVDATEKSVTRNRDDAIRVAYETGAYSYQQIAKEFGVHFTIVGRIVHQSIKRADSANKIR